jgi:hypothetical protein
MKILIWEIDCVRDIGQKYQNLIIFDVFSIAFFRFKIMDLRRKKSKLKNYFGIKSESKIIVICKS